MSTARASSGRARGRTCLVTGARGFLGQRLVPRLLEAGVRVTALDRQPGHEWPAGVDVLHGDLTEPGWAGRVRAAWRWDDVIHLAGPVAKGSTGFVEEAQVARAHVQITLALWQALPPGWS